MAGLAVMLVLAGVVVAFHDPPRVGAETTVPFVPDDPGEEGARGGWTDLQWNFVGPYGVDAPGAWGNLRAEGAAGGRGVTVAVLDTGVAYPGRLSSRPGSPDLDPRHVVAGWDFVDDDDDPYDENGHGTHVASTIAERSDNGVALTGLAYGVDIMPVRVLDGDGSGDAAEIARGVRFAVDHGAQVINLSLNFAAGVRPASLSDLDDALEYAHDHGSLVVAGAGNSGTATAAYPSRGPHVLAVGATTDSGCLASYSNHGDGVDLVAPGGGGDAHVLDDPNCAPGRRGQPVYQVTTAQPPHRGFAVEGFSGTSMAAPHVSGAAALVIASGTLGRHPSPDEIERRLDQTARDLGGPGHDSVYGWGLVDAAAATSPWGHGDR
jgi:serine protease